MVEMVPLRREMRGRFRGPDKKDTFSLHFFLKKVCTIKKLDLYLHRKQNTLLQ